MQTGMVVRNHSANGWGRREGSGQAGTGLPGHSGAVNVHSLSDKSTGRVPKMITGRGACPREEWRRGAKASGAVKGDQAKCQRAEGHWNNRRERGLLIR